MKLEQPYRLAIWMPYSKFWDVLWAQSFPSVEDAWAFGCANFPNVEIKVFKLVDPIEVDIPCGG